MKAFFVLLLLFCASVSVHAQIDWNISHKPVGAGPCEVFTDPETNRIYVLTSGIDADFDGIFEQPNDISAGCYVLDPAGNIIDSTLFGDFFNSFPIRVGVDLEEKIMYAPIGKTVKAFSLQTLEAINDLANYNYAAASFDSGTGILSLSWRAPDFTSPGEIIYFDPETMNLLAYVDAGVNPGNSIILPRADIGGTGFYTINEGGFGTPNASITYTSISSDLFGYVNEEQLGGGGSDMVVQGSHAFILMSGTHQVRIVDLLTNEEIAPSPIEIGTEGFDGPRALAVSGDTLFVGTYASDVRRFDLKTGTMIDAIAMPGKVEALAFNDAHLYAAIAYTAGTYDADSLLVVVDKGTGAPLDTLVVGGQPGAVMANKVNNTITVVGYGVGSSPTPWWKTIDLSTMTTVGDTLPFTLSFPLRVELESFDNKLMIVGSDTLFSVDISNPDATPESIYTDPIAAGALFGVSDGRDYWLVTERPLDFGATPCFVHAIRKSDTVRVAKIGTGGSFVLSAVPVPAKAPGALASYILHEGNFGSQDATLAFFEYAQNLYEGEFGSGANHIMHATDDHGREVTAVTMTGSHEVVILNFTAYGLPDIALRVPTGTTELDGPRQSTIAPGLPENVSNPLFVTTYTGEALLLGNGAVQERLTIGGKGEGIAALGDKVYTANSFETGTYTPGTTISIISLVQSSVDGGLVASASSLEQNYPNPANDRTTIPFSLAGPEHISLALYSTSGELIATLLEQQLEAGRHEATIETSSLPVGTYIYRLMIGAETFSKRMEVVR